MSKERVDITGFKIKPGARRSIKYLIIGQSVWNGIVFASDHIEAEKIARNQFEIPDDEELEVVRVIETSEAANKYAKVNDTVIHPD